MERLGLFGDQERLAFFDPAFPTEARVVIAHEQVVFHL